MARPKSGRYGDNDGMPMSYPHPRKKIAPGGFLSKSSREDRRQKRSWKRGRR